MKNNFIAILAYAEGECNKIIKYLNDIMEEGNICSPIASSTGNIVIDSIVDYWQVQQNLKELNSIQI